MKKTSLFLATAAAVGALTAAIPLLAHAQDDQQQPQGAPQNVPLMMQQRPDGQGQGDGQQSDQQGPEGQPAPGQGGMMRPGNLENNRDFRNTMMRREREQNGQGDQNGPTGDNNAPGVEDNGSSTAPRPMMRFEDGQQNRERNGQGEGMMPAWLLGSTTAPFGQHMDPEAMRQVMEQARMFATTSDQGQAEIERDRGQRHAALGVFAAMQSHLLSNLQDALGRLKDARSKIAGRISAAQQSGRDMTQATALLATADAKISAADAAIQSLSNLAPTVSTSGSTTVNASTTVSLTQPRQIGAAAIQAVKDARKALNDVVVAIAQAMGYQIGQDGRIIPPVASSTPETEGTTTASTTQQ